MLKIIGKYPDVNGLYMEFISISKQLKAMIDTINTDIQTNSAGVNENKLSINSNTTNITTNATAIASKADKVGSDDIEITDSAKGLILNDGTDRWRITIDSTGTLITTKL